MSSANTGTISFKLLDKIGLIAVTPTGWNKELNLVAWNGGMPKYDIRDWTPEHDRMSKGLTLREDELKGLHRLLLGMYGTKPIPMDEAGNDTNDEIECDENGEVINK